MKSSSLVSTGLAIGLAIAIAGPAGAQTTQPDMGSPGMMQRDGAAGTMGPGGAPGRMGQGMMGPGMMRGGMMGPGMMGGGMTGQGMMGSGMMGGGMMCPMMNSGMMQGGMGQGMMGQGMMGSNMMGGGTRAMFGTRVTPMMSLSVDDVRGYLDAQLHRLSSKRLKVGNVSADGATISAEIVTVDNSLVQRLKVDRHTGAIEYVD